MYLDIIRNLALLVALSSVSAFLALRWPRRAWLGEVLQGLLFGGVAVLGMLRPLTLGPGLIFDGRSVMVSLAALYFGPWAAVTAASLAVGCRLALGGAGALTGTAVILASAVLGLLGREHLRPTAAPLSAGRLFGFGLVVHVAMLALMFTLPGGAGRDVVLRIGLPILVLYPLATVLSGKILSDRIEADRLIQALRDSRENYRQLFDGGNDAIFVYPLANGVPQRFSEVNAVACARYGYSREELLGRRPVDIEAPGQERVHDQMVETLLREGRCVTEMTHVNKAGGTLSVEVSNWRLASGGQDKVLSTVRDITERQRAAAAIRESEERFRLLFDSARDAIFWAEADSGVLVRCNAAALALTGRRREEIIGQPQTILHPLGEGELYRHQFDEHRTLSPQRRLEADVVRADGQRVPVEITPSVVRLDGRTIVQGVFRDVTERRQAEAELASQVDELRRWYHSTLGREERIAALKREVNALAARLAETPPYPSVDTKA